MVVIIIPIVAHDVLGQSGHSSAPLAVLQVLWVLNLANSLRSNVVVEVSDGNVWDAIKRLFVWKSIFKLVRLGEVMNSVLIDLTLSFLTGNDGLQVLLAVGVLVRVILECLVLDDLFFLEEVLTS